jgi:hypothetical protein
VDVIRVRAPSSAHAERLLAALDGGFAATLDGDSPATEVELRPDGETAKKLVELFNALGLWLSSCGLDAVQIGFGERTYTLLAAPEGKSNDPTCVPPRAHDPATDRAGVADRDRAGEGNPR